MIELCDWIADGGLVEAHNVWFEYSIWNNICLSVHGFPLVNLGQWRCSAAKASSHALPRALEDLAHVLNVSVRKDMDGSRMMKKMMKPRKSVKKERERWAADGVAEPSLLYHEQLEQMQILWDYCRQDVLAEEAVSEALPDLDDYESAIFTLDLCINARGFQLDQTAVESALTLLKREFTTLNAELSKLTGGKVKKATERAKMIRWFADEGLNLPDTKGATIDDLLKSVAEGHRRDISLKAKRGLEILRALGRSSTAKYQAMANWASADWRVRGGLRYHGASTGRWAGAGVQPHNFPRGTVKDIELLWEVIKSLDAALIKAFQPDPKKKPGKTIGGVMEALSQGLRGAIVSSKGKKLYVADFSSIEARVLLWLAEDEDGLDIFRSGRDIYCEMASSPSLFNRPVSKDDSGRQLGKAAILGCGYQMGPAKFVSAAAIYGVTLIEDRECSRTDARGHVCGVMERFHKRENHAFKSDTPADTMTAARTVAAYRSKFWKVVQEWYEQEEAAISAVVDGGVVDAGYVCWFVEGDFLYCQLPSGRRLAYPFPRVEMKRTSWGQEKATLTYMGVDQFTRQWTRQSTYGGKNVENIVQAIARDLMVVGMVAAEEDGYETILTVHDEMIAEKADGDVEEFCRLMATVPDWAPGCPVAAEGWSGTRYRK
jgi:DNA polymerase